MQINQKLQLNWCRGFSEEQIDHPEINQSSRYPVLAVSVLEEKVFRLESLHC